MRRDEALIKKNSRRMLVLISKIDSCKCLCTKRHCKDANASAG